MILTEHPYKGNKKLIRTYSDDPTKALLQQETGAVYEEAIDRYPARYGYDETEKPEDFQE
nr:MAG TPA: hypothetical protein [Caudoviricetes sp.]